MVVKYKAISLFIVGLDSIATLLFFFLVMDSLVLYTKENSIKFSILPYRKVQERSIASIVNPIKLNLKFLLLKLWEFYHDFKSWFFTIRLKCYLLVYIWKSRLDLHIFWWISIELLFLKIQYNLIIFISTVLTINLYVTCQIMFFFQFLFFLKISVMWKILI